MSHLERLTALLLTRGYGERLLLQEPLSRYTSFRIGGAADLLVIVRDLEELVACLHLARATDVPALVIGKGSNILVADAGVRGLVIVNRCDRFAMDAGGLLRAESGALLRDLAYWTVEHGWAGLEWAEGIPGTLGGAVVGNAGAYGGCMADIVLWVRLWRPDGSVVQVPGEALEYGYRSSALKRESSLGQRSIVLEVALRLAPGDADVLRERVAAIAARRRERTPIGASAGSIFKRTLQYPAGFLIDRAGLKGCRIGDAEVSEKHANFLMNRGHATAAEMRALIHKVQREVWAVFAQRLEPEIELVGDWSAEDTTDWASVWQGAVERKGGHGS